jgi:hypothetical protein
MPFTSSVLLCRPTAAQTFCGVAGMVRSLLPMASVMALMTAGGEPIAPPRRSP